MTPIILTLTHLNHPLLPSPPPRSCCLLPRPHLSRCRPSPRPRPRLTLRPCHSPSHFLYPLLSRPSLHYPRPSLSLPHPSLLYPHPSLHLLHHPSLPLHQPPGLVPSPSFPPTPLLVSNYPLDPHLQPPSGRTPPSPPLAGSESLSLCGRRSDLAKPPHSEQSSAHLTRSWTSSS